MKDHNTPATKADIQGLLKEFGSVNERIEGLDRKLEDFRTETGEKLDSIEHQLRLLVEASHRDLGDASHDAEEVLKDKYERLDKRVTRLEETVGLTAA
jgi:archaellum component FlaC